MRAINIFLMLVLLASSLSAADGDTTKVQVHNAVDMTWYGNYDQVGVFPAASATTYRKIWMRYTLGCASGGCSDWDYTTQIFLMHPTGLFDSTVQSIDTITLVPFVTDTTWNVFEVIDPLEMGRVITPYGNSLPNSWKREFVFDVTDLAAYLQDSVLIRAFYSGWSNGFSVTLDFDFIEGIAPREVLSLSPIYKGDGTYTNSANFETSFLNPKSVQIPAGISAARIFSTITGHGFDNSAECAEFCIRNYDVKINSTTAASGTIWRDDCGSNPLYPQAGTWLLDRAGWCPGERAITHEWEVGSFLQQGQANTIDFDMQNYTWSGTQAPSYTVNSHIVCYGPIHFNNDAYLLDIIAPNNYFEYNRLNPICAKPKLKVQNTGANNLTDITFQYRVDGAAECTYTWTGNLPFLAIAEIELPNLNWTNADLVNRRFYAEIVGVNGGNDEYASNNTANSAFEMPTMYNYDTIYVELRTNNRGSETGYQILDPNGNIVFQRAATGLTAATTYRDKIYFAPGCYTLKVTDSGKDGLAFWADAAAGTGYIQLSRFIQQFNVYAPFKNFDADFGTSIYFPFIIGPDLGAIDDNSTSGCVLSSTETSIKTVFESTVYPNPSEGTLNIALKLEQRQPLTCRLYNALGQLVKTVSFEELQYDTVKMETENLPNGLYLLEMSTKQQRWTESVLIQKP